MFALLLNACAVIRSATYPPEYIYLTDKELQSAMGDMATSLSSIDRLLDSSTLNYVPTLKIIAHLNNMLSVTNSLGEGNIDTNHLLLNAHLDEFQTSLQSAKTDLQKRPPDYLRVGKLIGTCSACHRLH